MSSDALTIHVVCNEPSLSTDQSLRTCRAAASYTQKSSIPYAAANSSIWQTVPKNLNDAIDTIAYNTVSALTYRATGPTGPTGGSTGPSGPTLQMNASLVPTLDATYDLGATGIRFKDEFLSGSLYMGATGASGVNIIQTGSTPSHTLEDTATGSRLNYLQTLTKPGLYTTSAVYGPLTPGSATQIQYAPKVIINSARGSTTASTGLTDGDIMGAVLFNENSTGPGGYRSYIISSKIGGAESESVSLQLGTIQGGGFAAIAINSTGPTGPTGGATGPIGKNIALTAHMYPTDNAFYNLGATGYQFKDIFFSGELYKNGLPFSDGGGVAGTDGQFTYNNAGSSAGSDALVYRATGPTGPTGNATGPAPDPTIQIGSHIVPTQDLAYDLGATGLRFRDIYVGGSSIHLGDSVTLSASGANLSVNSATVVTGATVPNTGPGGPAVTFSSRTALQTLNNINIPGTIAMSTDGKYITYITSSSSVTGNIYVSSNYGASFSQSPSSGYSMNTAGGQTTQGIAMNSLNYVAVGMSASGQYQTLVEYLSGGIFVSSNYGVSWVETNQAYIYNPNVDPGQPGLWSSNAMQPTSWGGVCVSSNGQVQVAWVNANTSYYISKDIVPREQYTLTKDWTSATFSDLSSYVAMSSNGDRVLQHASGYSGPTVNGFKVTTSLGLTSLSSSGSPIVLSMSLGFDSYSVRLSGDGTRIGVYGSKVTPYYSYAACTQQYSWTITDSGTIAAVGSVVFFNQTYANYTSPVIANMTSNGTIQLVAPGAANNAAGIYISYNSGVTWSLITDANITGTYWNYILISADGTYTNVIHTSGSPFYQCLATSFTKSVITYTPAVPANWPTAYQPTTVTDALDTIAKYLQASQAMGAWTNLT